MIIINFDIFFFYDNKIEKRNKQIFGAQNCIRK
jgi:hypothetical protein